MSRTVNEQLAALAARLDEQLGELRRQGDAARTVGSARGRRQSLITRLRCGTSQSPWAAVEARLSDLEHLRSSFKRQAASAQANADEWERRAQLSVRAHDDDLAREALERRRAHLVNVAHLDACARQLGAVLEEARLAIQEIRRHSSEGGPPS